MIVNIDRFGNTTAGTIPLAMNTALEEGTLKKGSLVLLASVGAGFTRRHADALGVLNRIPLFRVMFVCRREHI